MFIGDEKEAYKCWLLDEKRINARVVKDILSRTIRVSKIVDLTDHRPTNHIVLDLTNSDSFKECTMCVRSQLKRCVLLYREFKGF